MPGTLYVVATPIGNLEDITHRALRILRECDLIAAEDTRVTRKLLSHFDIHTPLTSYHQHTKEDKAASLVKRLADGGSIALVSDAGTPGISDPGAALISLAILEGVTIIPVPGASALLCALVASGLPTGRFTFDGFPPRTRTDRREFFSGLKAERRTIVLYEAPTRLVGTLSELLDHLGDRQIAAAREVTKKFEEVFRGPLSKAVAHFRACAPRGEFTLVVQGAPEGDEAVLSAPVDPRASLRRAIREGLSGRDAVQQVAQALRLPRRIVYSAFLELSKHPDEDP